MYAAYILRGFAMGVNNGVANADGRDKAITDKRHRLIGACPCHSLAASGDSRRQALRFSEDETQLSLLRARLTAGFVTLTTQSA